jgi:hypothetical protein
MERVVSTNMYHMDTCIGIKFIRLLKLERGHGASQD